MTYPWLMCLVWARENANADRASWAATSKLQIDVSGFAPRLRDAYAYL